MSQFELLKELFSELKFTKHTNDAFSELTSLIGAHTASLLNQNEVISIDGDSKDEENGDNGRIGPNIVAFSKNKKYSFGNFELDEQGLTIVSLENFVSVRANVCVFKGKWMYETLLMTNGIFQIGWATMSCPFTNEEGAGDAPDSFAYDGKRQKKWNVSSLKYGEIWEVGDIIGSCIDLDNGTITFYRNGKCLGTAFQNVRIKETGLVYFPTISLSIRESAYFNFGDIPFAYPVSGYEPLQYPNLPNLSSTLPIYLQQSSYFCEKIEKILFNYPINEDGKVPTRENQLLQHTYFHAFNILLDCYLPLLFTENCAIIPFFDFFSTLPKHLFDLLFDLLETCLEVPQKVPLIKRIMWYIGYRASTTQWTTESSSIPFLLISSQLIETSFFINISQAVQAQTEEFLEKLLSVKQPNENDIAKIFPKIWFNSKSANYLDVFNLEESFDEEAFENNGKIISEMFIQYLKIFESIFANLLSQNFLFKWLRSIVKRNKGAHQDILPPKLTNANVMSNIFIILLQFLGIDKNENGDFFSHNKLFKDISPSQFEIKLFYKSYENYDNEVPSDNYFDLPRLGGSFSHLLRSVSISEFVEGEKERSSTEFSILFDAMITLYHLGARDRLQIIGERVSTIEDTIATLYNVYLYEKKIQKQLFAQLVPYIRLLAWEKVWFGNYLENNSIFDFWTSLQYLLQVFNQVKLIGQPNLIQYVPELYIDSICEGFNYCRRGINIYDSFNQKNISESSILNVYSLFILHFSDSNIINPDMREKLLKSISIILQSQTSARLFEKSEHVKYFIQSLFHSITSSMWYSVVMIIASFSKGHSFGIRDPSLTSSRVLMDLFKEFSFADVTLFNKLLNQLFNQLNTFATEFRKDIKDIRHYNEADNDMVRLKKRCSMIYELISKMFCVIEMIANECPQLLLESKLNMTRLSELILLFLSIPVNPPHSEYFSLFISLLAEAKVFTMHLLGPISGIMTSLHTYSVENPNKNHCTIIKSLISLEESYSPKFFEALTSSLSELDNPSFPFKITDDLVVLKEFVLLLNKSFSERSKEEVIEDEETVCTICYAQQRNSVFIPCKHQSCEQCIVRHLLNNDKCFFCNTPIASVEKLADKQ